MAGPDIPPTRSNLRKIKAELSFAYEGFDLLEQKREILVMEIVRQVNKIKILEERIISALERLYESYRESALAMGSAFLTLKTAVEDKKFTLTVDYTRTLGIDFPFITLHRRELAWDPPLPGTDCGYDILRERAVNALVLMAEYASLTKSIFILSRELKKVQRRVNALEKIFIPRHEETKKYISDRLEEMEREELFIKKMIGQRST